MNRRSMIGGAAATVAVARPLAAKPIRTEAPAAKAENVFALEIATDEGTSVVFGDEACSMVVKLFHGDPRPTRARELDPRPRKDWRFGKWSSEKGYFERVSMWGDAHGHSREMCPMGTA